MGLFSIEAEQAVLGGLMEDPQKFADVFDVLTESDFYDVKHRKYFGIMSSLANDGRVFDAVVISDLLPDDPEALGYLVELHANATAANIVTYAHIIADRAVERMMAASGQRVHEIATDPDMALDDKVNAVHSEFAAMERNERTEIPEFNVLLKGEVEDIDRRWRGDMPLGMKTGFTCLDERFGGLEASDLWIIAARPAMGKTTLLMNIAQNVATQGKEVLIFSLEMSKEQLTKRLLASASGLPYGVLRSGKLEENHWPALSAGASKLKDLKIHIVDIACIDVNRALAISRKFARHGNLGAIAVDYLQLMTDKTSNNRFEEVSNVSRKLKAIAKTCEVPVITLSQLSRKVEERSEKRPNNADLRESGQLEQDADVITFIYRDEVYNEKSMEKGVAELITTKFRNGEIGTDRVLAELQYSRFRDFDYAYTPPPPSQKPKRGGLD